MQNKKQIRIINPADIWQEAVTMPNTFGDHFKGLKTGLKPLDDVFTGLDGEHLIIYGLPNMGKTTIIQNILKHQATKQQRRTAIFAPEEFSAVHVVRSLAENLGEQDITEMAEHRATNLEFDVKEYFRIIDAPRIGVYWADLENAIRITHKDFNFKNIVIDHAMMLEKTEMSHEDNVKFFMNSIIELCAELGVFAIIVNHVAKPDTRYDSNNKHEFVPPQRPHKMAHGQMWERLGFNILEVFRPDQITFGTHPTEVWLSLYKVKNPNAGEARQRMKMFYHKERRTFYDWPPEIEGFSDEKEEWFHKI